MKFSLKNATFNSLQEALQRFEQLRGESERHEVCFLTAAGFITGTIVEPEPNNSSDTQTTQIETEKKKIGFDLSVIRELRDNSLRMFTRKNPNTEVVDNASIINLKDVTVISTANPEQAIKVQQMMVFVDQIIGFSLNIEP